MAKREELELHSAYNPRRIAVEQEAGPEPSMTRQEFAEECDVNQIMARYQKTGMLPGNAPGREPQYLDLTVVPSDLMESMHQLHVAEDAFASLPAHVRKELDNDPYRFVEFAADPDNLGKLREWGLAPPEKVPEPPMRVEVINPPPKEEKPPAKD